MKKIEKYYRVSLYQHGDNCFIDIRDTEWLRLKNIPLNGATIEDKAIEVLKERGIEVTNCLIIGRCLILF